MVNTKKAERTNGLFSNKVYDVLKFCALVAFPAVGSLYYGLAGIWHFPDAEQVVGSIVVVDTFLGVVLRISSTAYNASGAGFDGTLDVHPADENGHQVALLNLNDAAESVITKDQVSFKVRQMPPGSATPGELPQVPPVNG